MSADNINIIFNIWENSHWGLEYKFGRREWGDGHTYRQTDKQADTQIEQTKGKCVDEIKIILFCFFQTDDWILWQTVDLGFSFVYLGEIFIRQQLQ